MAELRPVTRTIEAVKGSLPADAIGSAGDENDGVLTNQLAKQARRRSSRLA